MTKEQLDYYNKCYFGNDEPIPFTTKFNNYVLYIKPVYVKDYGVYAESVGVLLIDKNRINDVRIIQMSYLQFLGELMNDNETYRNALVNVLSFSLDGDFTYTIGYDEKNKIYLGLRDSNTNELVTRISAKEFNQISEIILHYNDMDYDDRIISEDLRNAMEDYYKLKFKDHHIPTLEEKKAFVTIKTGLSMSNLNNMSYRNFELIYNTAQSIDIFFSQRILQASEKYKVEDLVYPLFKERENKFSFLQDADGFKHTLESAART